MMNSRGNFEGHGFYGSGMMGSGWHYLIMGGILLITIILVVYLIKKLKVGYPNGLTSGQVNDPALDLLKMKYVQGEITEEEYNQKKTTLKGI